VKLTSQLASEKMLQLLPELDFVSDFTDCTYIQTLLKEICFSLVVSDEMVLRVNKFCIDHSGFRHFPDIPQS